MIRFHHLGSVARMLLVVMAIAVAAVPAAAQDRAVSFNIGVGPVFPTGGVADVFDTGFTVPAGVTVNVTENIGVQAEYMGAWMNGPSRVVNDPVRGGLNRVQLESNHTLHAGTFNVVFKTPQRGAVGGYVVAGPGFYRRSVEITTPDTGFVQVCEPQWYLCYPALAPVPVDRVVGSRSTTDFGFNVGGGVTFGAFYVEVRYHYTRGPRIGPQQLAVGQGAEGERANGHYVPINFGVRF